MDDRAFFPYSIDTTQKSLANTNMSLERGNLKVLTYLPARPIIIRFIP